MIPDYISAVLNNLTLSAMKSDDVSIVVAAVEFWNVIAEEEKERTDYNMQVMNRTNGKVLYNHTRNNLKALLKGLTDILLKYEDEEMAESGRSIHDASFKCLMAINDVAKEDGFEDQVTFVKIYIAEQNTTKIIAALTVFSSMVETMPQVKMAEYVKPSFMKFIEYLNPNYDLRIRVSVSDLLARIAQYYTDSFLDETIANKVFEV